MLCAIYDSSLLAWQTRWTADIYVYMNKPTYTDQQFIDAVKTNKSVAATLRKLDLKSTGGNYCHFYEVVERLHISIAHFTGQGHGIGHPAWNKQTEESLFVKDSGKRLNRWQRHLLIKNEILGDCCTKCGLKGTWRGETITLQIDHINGDPHDNRIENLRLLCPNCHSQTPTWCAKNKKNNNRKRGVRVKTADQKHRDNFKKPCMDCGKKVYRDSLRCGDCNRKLLGSAGGT